MELIRRSSVSENLEYFKSLPPMPRAQILCGKNSGLPFEYLMTDVMSGCLPVSRMCYGNCSAAQYWFDKGHDFGKRVLNEFSAREFRKSIEGLPKEQRWLRQGWASDCSFSAESWLLVMKSAEILAEYNISLLIITKAFLHPSKDVIQVLARTGTEVRTSISAFDHNSHLEHRKNLLNIFRDAGGKSVPYVMSAKFEDSELASKQNAIVEWIVENDFIGSEHPLRLNSDNSGLKYLKKDGYWHPKFPDQYWFGRIYSDISNIILPPPTHLLPQYTLTERFASAVPPSGIPWLDGNLPTFDELAVGRINNLENLEKHATYGTE